MCRVSRIAFVVFLTSAVATVLSQQSQQALSQEPIALINANVLNVSDGTVQRNVTVVLRDGRIASVGPAQAGAGMRTFDVRGRYVAPGLIDAHVHIANGRALRTALESGVTTARSS